MTDDNDEYVQLADFLSEQGHTQIQIEKIIARVRKYEEDTKLYSVMDSIGSGHLDLSSLIKEALADETE